MESQQIQLADLPAISFIIGGFPKCGTTTLLYALLRHKEIKIPSRESCALKDTWRKTFRVRQRFQEEVKEILDAGRMVNNQTDNVALPSSPTPPNLLTGLKCPTAIYSDNFMRRLHEINQHHEGKPNIKWVVGIRHPVWQVQSFYNYRITELYDRNAWWKDIRSLQDIMFSDVPWKDISSVAHRYEQYLGNLLSFLRKTLSSQDPPSPIIFLYTMDQIQDSDPKRSWRFRKDLSHFLGLVKDISLLGKENVNRFVSGPKKHDEVINICEEQFGQVRKKLVKDSSATASWIQQNILAPKIGTNTHSVTDVTSFFRISDPDYVFQILNSWKVDPCF